MAGAVPRTALLIQVRDVLATQTLAMDKLKVRRININGVLGTGVYAKDVILYIIPKVGIDRWFMQPFKIQCERDRSDLSFPFITYYEAISSCRCPPVNPAQVISWLIVCKIFEVTCVCARSNL